MEAEKLLKQNGTLLDLGSATGSASEPFLRFGYTATLVDHNADILLEADERFKLSGLSSYITICEEIDNFQITQKYDMVCAVNVLSFIHKKEIVARIVQSSYEHLNPGGFIFFTVFGIKDQWAEANANTMSFYKEEDASNFLEIDPYFVSEDRGLGLTMSGDIKNWHIFYYLYRKM